MRIIAVSPMDLSETTLSDGSEMLTIEMSDVSRFYVSEEGTRLSLVASGNALNIRPRSGNAILAENVQHLPSPTQQEEAQ